ncbi:MAG: hypothetical protein O3A81_03415 [bacterium]|nr:hypothetical protein [bacterium]
MNNKKYFTDLTVEKFDSGVLQQLQKRFSEVLATMPDYDDQPLLAWSRFVVKHTTCIFSTVNTESVLSFQVVGLIQKRRGKL